MNKLFIHKQFNSKQVYHRYFPVVNLLFTIFHPIKKLTVFCDQNRRNRHYHYAGNCSKNHGNTVLKKNFGVEQQLNGIILHSQIRE